MRAIYNGNLIEVLSKSMPKQPILSNTQKVSQAKNCKIVNFLQLIFFPSSVIQENPMNSWFQGYFMVSIKSTIHLLCGEKMLNSTFTFSRNK